MGFAVMSVIKFYVALKEHIGHDKPLAKIIAFKIIVGLTFLESVSPSCVTNSVPLLMSNILDRILGPSRLAQIESNGNTHVR